MPWAAEKHRASCNVLQGLSALSGAAAKPHIKWGVKEQHYQTANHPRVLLRCCRFVVMLRSPIFQQHRESAIAWQDFQAICQVVFAGAAGVDCFAGLLGVADSLGGHGVGDWVQVWQAWCSHAQVAAPG